jgi:hypothetical protein
VQIRLKSDSNEGHFTLAGGTVFRQYFPTNWSVVTDIFHTAHPEHALRAVKVRVKSISNEGHFTLDVE